MAGCMADIALCSYFVHSASMSHVQSPLPQDLRVKARGARSNDAGRFEPMTRMVEADGWELPQEERLLRTEVREERPRSALSFNASPDLPFDRSVNPYRGCEHGCVYCYARPSHAYLNLSPGLDFETKLIARPGIGSVLEREIGGRGYKVAPVALGTNTDPYQPIEAKYGAMREVIAVLARWNHPLAITTKGTLIERDLDILGPMGRAGLLRVGISITTLDAGLSRALEPRVALPARRLAVIRRLAEAGIPVRVMVAPVIPGLTDSELEAILAAGRAAGAVAASWILLRLPGEVAGLMKDWLEAHVPERAAKILKRLNELHAGQDYDPRFGQRMRGKGVWADLLAARFQKACTREGLSVGLPPLRSDLFARPVQVGDQLSLF